MAEVKKNKGGSNFQHVDYQEENKALIVRLKFYELVMQGLERMDIPVHEIEKNYKNLYSNYKCLDNSGMRKKLAVGRVLPDHYHIRNCKTAMYPCRMAMTWEAFAECESLTGSNQIFPFNTASIKDAEGTILSGTGILEICIAN